MIHKESPFLSYQRESSVLWRKSLLIRFESSEFKFQPFT
jgi:hypothetical protein